MNLAEISDILYWMFNTRDGVLALIVVLPLVFILVAITTEKKTKRMYYNHEDDSQ